MQEIGKKIECAIEAEKSKNHIRNKFKNNEKVKIYLPTNLNLIQLKDDKPLY